MLRSGEGERNKEGGKSLYFEIGQSKDKINEARIEECQRTLYIPHLNSLETEMIRVTKAARTGSS
jgi:hypothetical protein